MAEDDGLLAEDDGKKMIMTIPPGPSFPRTREPSGSTALTFA